MTMRALTGWAVLPLLIAVGCAPGSEATSGDEALSQQSGLSSATITFGDDFSETVSGDLAAGGEVQVNYDADRLTDCRGTQGGIDQWAITGWWRVDGGESHALAVAGLNSSGSAPVFQLPNVIGELEMWFQNNNKWGCNAYDSNWSKNYKFDIGGPEGGPHWMGKAVSVINRWTCNNGEPCDDNRVPLDSGSGPRFDTWARQRATIAALYFDVWEPGVTDFDNPDLWKELDVRVYTRLAGEAAFSWDYVSFYKRVGNDARYEVKLRPIDPLGGSTVIDPADCPPQLEVTPDGFYVRTTMEVYFTVNGVELRPSPDAAYTMTWEDYVGLYAVCLP